MSRWWTDSIFSGCGSISIRPKSALWPLTMLVCSRCGAAGPAGSRIARASSRARRSCSAAHRGQSRAVEAVIEMRAVPADGRFETDRNGLGSGWTAVGHEGKFRVQGSVFGEAFVSSGGSTTISSGGISTIRPSRQTTIGTPSCLCLSRASRPACSSASSMAKPWSNVCVMSILRGAIIGILACQANPKTDAVARRFAARGRHKRRAAVHCLLNYHRNARKLRWVDRA